MLHINDLTFRIGGRTLLDNATVVVPAGHKVGLVGRNGTGKSTLFKLILGEYHAESGELRLRSRARIGCVSQQAPNGPESLIDTVLAADLERASLLEEAETATDPHRIADIHLRLADIDAHTAPARASAILSGLGFDEAAQQRPCSDFSGGWQMRVALASTLFTNPDFLLLDEPSNHLDLEAVMWLEDYLVKYQGTILVISHERSLLNVVVDQIIHLENNKLTRYTGNYDQFEQTRRERLELVAKLQTKQLAQRRHLESFVDRFRAKASKAKQAQSRLKMLERMEPIVSVIEEQTFAFTFPNPDRMPPPLISLEGVSVGYQPGKPILRNIDLRIDMEDRIALLGANGNGKSTLIKLLAGRLETMEGSLRRPGKLKVGYFAQHQTDELDLNGTPFTHMAAIMPGFAESKIRAQLGRFGFGQDRANITVSNLSGGEKARLLFALMSREAPHLMFMDEPTNHLDVDSREALVQAINAYEGAVVLVSHDSHLLELTCDRLLIIEDGNCLPFDGDLEDYKRRLIDKKREEKRDNKSDSGERLNKKDARKERVAQRAAQAPLRKAVKNAEQKVEKIQKQKEAIEVKLSEPGLFEKSESKFHALQADLAAINRDLQKAEEAWLAAEEALEQAS